MENILKGNEFSASANKITQKSNRVKTFIVLFAVVMIGIVIINNVLKSRSESDKFNKLIVTTISESDFCKEGCKDIKLIKINTGAVSKGDISMGITWRALFKATFMQKNGNEWQSKRTEILSKRVNGKMITEIAYVENN